MTITGAKNAKLICIKDDNSDYEIAPEEKRIQIETVKSVASHTQTELIGNERKNKCTQKPITCLKRMKKPSKKLETLPKENAVNIIQYKLDFHKYCKHNSMYRKTNSIVPWKLMTR